MKRAFLQFVLLVLLVAPALAQAPAQVPAQVPQPARAPVVRDVQSIAAVVNHEVISVYDVLERMKLVILSTDLKDTPETRQRLLPLVLRSLIDEHLQVQEADRLNLKVSDEEIGRLRPIERLQIKKVVLDDAPRSATAVALGPTRTLLLPREAFLALTDEARTVRRGLLASLAVEIRSITDHVHDLHFLDLPGRLARRILREAATGGREIDGGVRVPWPYTQADLAGMIGASRQSVNRVLADLAARDLIRVERDALVIPDRLALERSIGR